MMRPLKLILTSLSIANLSSAATIPTEVSERALEQRATCATGAKRGLAYNDPLLTKPFTACSQGGKVSWSYNWYSNPYSGATKNGYNTAINFIPMLWSTASDLTSIWNTNVLRSTAIYGTDAVLAFNEPDGCGGGGSCMSLTDAISGYQTWVSPLRTKFPKLKLGAPAVTNGGGTMGLTYLKQFLAGCTGCNIDFIPIHWYGDASDITGFKNQIAKARVATGLKYPLWITEFGHTSGTQAQVEAFLKSVLPWMDSQSYIQRYAYFMDANGFMINSTTGGLSNTGKIYNTL